MHADAADERRTILLVDDDQVVRTFATRVLRRAGFRVVTADSGDSGLEAYARHRESILLLVTDVLMPGMNGVELAEQLRMERPDLAVLFVSGYPADIPSGRRLLTQGAPLLEKPFTGAQLVARVEEALAAAGNDRRRNDRTG